MRRKVITTHSNEVRDSCWTLIQFDDLTLHVEQEVIQADGQQMKRITPINDFIREGGPPPRCLQKMIDRMFVNDEGT